MLKRSSSIPIAIASASHVNDDSDDSSSNSENSDDIPVYGLSESLSNMHLANSSSGRSAGYHEHSMAHSLPPPRAPFLSARNLPGDRLSSIPQITLPESIDSISPASEQQVQPYGSLRSSRFHFHHRRRNEFKNNSCAMGSSSSDSNEDDATKDTIIYPRSVPTHKEIDRDWVAKRWAEQRKRNRQNKKQIRLDETCSSDDDINKRKQQTLGLTQEMGESSLDFKTLSGCPTNDSTPSLVNIQNTSCKNEMYKYMTNSTHAHNNQLNDEKYKTDNTYIYESDETLSSSRTTKSQLSTSLTAFEMLETSRKSPGGIMSMKSSLVEDNTNSPRGFTEEDSNEYKAKQLRHSFESDHNPYYDHNQRNCSNNDNGWQNCNDDPSGDGYASDPDTFAAFEME